MKTSHAPSETLESFSTSTSVDHRDIPFAKTSILTEAQDSTDNYLCLAGDLVDDEINSDTMRPQDAKLDALLKYLTNQGVETHDESFNLFFTYMGRRISVKEANSFKVAMTMMKNEGRTLFNFVFHYRDALFDTSVYSSSFPPKDPRQLVSVEPSAVLSVDAERTIGRKNITASVAEKIIAHSSKERIAPKVSTRTTRAASRYVPRLTILSRTMMIEKIILQGSKLESIETQNK